MNESIQFNNRTFTPTGRSEFGCDEYTDKLSRMYVRKGEQGMEVLCGYKNAKPLFIPLSKAQPHDIAWWVDESKYDLTGYTLLD